tara:strand:- start:479 stop:760 length:282 start_codon:yes stop_codon:yes gene_type:complete
LVVLVQNPKGGGLSSTFGGGGNQMMGVKKTTDFLEKATWTLAISLISLSLLSNFAIPRENTEDPESIMQEQIDQSLVPQQVPNLPEVNPTENE